MINWLKQLGLYRPQTDNPQAKALQPKPISHQEDDTITWDILPESDLFL